MSKTRSMWILVHAVSGTVESVFVCAALVALYELVKWGTIWFWEWFGFEFQIWQAPVTILWLIFCGSLVIFFFDARNQWQRRICRMAEEEQHRIITAENTKLWQELSENAAVDFDVVQSMSDSQMSDVN